MQLAEAAVTDFQEENLTEEKEDVYITNPDCNVRVINKKPELEKDDDIISLEKIREVVSAQDLSVENKDKLIALLSEFRHLFSKKPGLASCFAYDIKVSDEKYFVEKSYPVPFVHREAVEAQLQQMLDYGIIEKASSLYIDPIVVVKKPR